MSTALVICPPPSPEIANIASPQRRPHAGLRIADALPEDPHLPPALRPVAKEARAGASAFRDGLAELRRRVSERESIYRSDHQRRVEALDRGAELPEPRLHRYDAALTERAREVAALADVLDRRIASWEAARAKHGDAIEEHVRKRARAAREKWQEAHANAAVAAAALAAEERAAELLGVAVARDPAARELLRQHH